ncbi:hypothetical protein [Paenibacillus aceti]|uniref:Uncharacterized protein n=1 Tax=Paenibacillus aceti TaxID=1820010 RepID=A0ABQ1VZ22_9BACL|nr:hypothetical protein [Paenibacillus aceti]GGG04722.1 hypothetical protein GCM10010913_28220 [Paenibacillus aceti]
MRRLRLGFYFKDLFKVRALKQRLIFVVVIETIVILLILAVVSYEAIHSIEKNKLKTSMVIDLQQLTDKMEESYKNMAQVSQQMSPDGTVGSLLGDYFQENSNFEKYQLGRRSRIISLKLLFRTAISFAEPTSIRRRGRATSMIFCPMRTSHPMISRSSAETGPSPSIACIRPALSGWGSIRYCLYHAVLCWRMSGS